MKKSGLEKVINELFGYSQAKYDILVSYEDDVLEALFLAYSEGWDAGQVDAGW